MGTTYLDVEGLTHNGPVVAYAAAINISGVVISGHERLRLLASLHEGAGVTVLTGPLGAPFWSYVSPEIRIRIVPDGTEYTNRAVSATHWSYLASGCSVQQAKELLGRETPPTENHRLYAQYRASQSILGELLALDVSPIVTDDLNVQIVENEDEQFRLLDSLEEVFTSLDWEWVPEENNRPIGISVSTLESNYYLPASSNGLRDKVYQANLSGMRTVWHNARSDLGTQSPVDPINWKPVDDTLLLAYLVQEPELDLETLAKKYNNTDLNKRLRGPLKDYSLALQARYACADSRATYDLFFKLRDKLSSTHQYHVYETLEKPLVPVIASMERYGQPVSPDALNELYTELVEKEEELLQQGFARWNLDISDDTQTKESIKRELGYDIGSVDQRILSKIPDDWMDIILSYRKTRTLRRNFVEKHLARWSERGFPADYRVFPSFNQAGSADELTGRNFKAAPRTGRLSSSGDVNFQNQPRGIRRVFVAPPGQLLVSLDYAALELRIAAAVSNDPTMLSIFNNGDDIHNFMQDAIMRTTGKMVSRTGAKNGNFNVGYGGTADMLVTISAKERAHLSYEDAKAIVDTHHSTYTGYWGWYDRLLTQARVLGYTETLLGRRRYNDDLFSQDSTLKGHAERAALNHIIQGTSADLVKQAMLDTIPVVKAYGAHLAAQVHDSMLYWCPADTAKYFLEAVKDVMQSINLPGIKLVVHGGVGNTWSEAEAA